LIWFIWSVLFIWLISFNQTNQINKRNQPVLALHAPRSLALADFLSIMLKQVHGVVTGLAIQAQEADRPDAAKIADVLNGKTKQDILTSACVPRREHRSRGLTAMMYQEEADLVERPVLGAKSSVAWSVPHSCRATVIIKDGRVTDVRFASVPEWLGAENHCKKIFARCSQ
jgi:hypothetical protein